MSADSRAQSLQFVPLAGPYLVPEEQPMIDRVLADLNRGQISYKVVILSRNTREIWRTLKGYHTRSSAAA